MSSLRARTRRFVRPVLAVPLWVKLIGANAIIVVVAVIALTHTGYHDGEYHRLLATFFIALVASVVLNVVLVIVALLPLRTVEFAAAEVWRGNTAARVPESMLADRDIARVGHTINLLVDSLLHEGARSRELTALVISQAESNQARIAHELHESAAQRLAAQVMQISTISRNCNEPHTRLQLDELRDTTAGTLEELRMMARTMNAPLLHRDFDSASQTKQRARTIDHHATTAHE